MKKEKPSPNELSIQEQEKKNALRRDLYFLKPLLTGLDNEKEISLKDAIKIVGDDSNKFKGAVLIASYYNCFRHISIVALSKFYNRNTKFSMMSTNNIVNAWYSSDSGDYVNSAVGMLKPDVLILFGEDSFANDTSKSAKRKIVGEVMTTRKQYNKDTWLFCNAKDIEKLLDKNFGITNYIDSTVDLDRIVEEYRNREVNDK